jgi:hypothetical protein
MMGYWAPPGTGRQLSGLTQPKFARSGGKPRDTRRSHLEGAVESVLHPEVLAQAYGTGVDVVQDPATGQPRIHR